MHKNPKKFIAVSLILLQTFSAQIALALPQGESLVSGGASFDRSLAGQLTINQTTDKIIVNYQSFSIGQSEAVRFFQPGSLSIALNRVTSGDPSTILGSLQSNGIIYLVNANGILFGSGAQVNVGGLVASTLNISNADFLAGQYNFQGQGGVVINKGNISAPGGYIALLGSSVLNTGVIQANLGSVALAAGEAITLNLDSQGLIGVVVDQATTQNLMDQNAAIVNKGTLSADGGKVLISAKALNTVFDRAINTEGVIQAQNLVEKDGQISLFANGDIAIAGEIAGGSITVESTEGDVTHQSLSQVTTGGKNFHGKAAGDYVLENGASIDSGNGVIDIFAGQNILLGSPDLNNLRRYCWRYISGERSYRFVEFGYYLNQDGYLVYFPLAQGPDVGKDGSSPTHGWGYIYETSLTPELFTTFTSGNSNLFFQSDQSGTDTRTYYSDPSLNESGLNHVAISGDTYAWEDIWELGDHDFNDAVLSFHSEVVSVPQGAFLNSSTNIFLTAANGGIHQTGGDIHAENLMLSTNTGMDGAGTNGGLQSTAANVSAVNHGSGDIKLDSPNDLTVADLRSQTGLNSGVTGSNGIENQSLGGKIDVATEGSLTVAAPITGRGNIAISAANDIIQKTNGKIAILQDLGALNAPQHVISTSHQVDVWSNNPTIDVRWDLPARAEGTFYNFTANAGGKYKMESGSEVKTNNGDATITANDDILLTLVDANNGNVSISSEHGSIFDNDSGQTPTDYDVIGHTITLTADEGTVGGTGLGEEIDLGHPELSFSFLFDLNNISTPDIVPDFYQTHLDADGNWYFTTSFMTTQDSDHWWFHIATLEQTHSLFSPVKHLGPFLIDTTAPIIFADYPEANPYGWYNYDVTVGFHAADNLSGFAPEGSLAADLNSETVTQEGLGLLVTSDGIFDRAGNAANPLEVSLNIDKTPPVITSGQPSGPVGSNGNYIGPVTVPFSATDSLSGVAPEGVPQKDLDPKTTAGTGDNLTVTSDGAFDLAGNFAPGLLVGPFAIENGDTPPPINQNLATFFGKQDEFKVYYEILDPSRFVSIEPTQKLGFYAYHPVAETDMSAFEEIDMDVRAFEFIDNNIERKKQLAPYFESK